MRRACLAALLLSACDPAAGGPSYAWELPEGLEPPPVPEDNPMSAAKVELGRRLFYDTRLSVTGEHACSSCHRQEHAFTDGAATPVGANGEHGPRSAMSLVNVGYAANLTWGNPVFDTLEEQALAPLFLDEPLELGAQFVIDDVLRGLALDEEYTHWFETSFPDHAEPINVANVARALAAFERTIVAVDAPYDRYLRGDATAMDASARRGMGLFFSKRVGCGECHSGRLLDGARGRFENVGLYHVDEQGAYPSPNAGLYEFTHEPSDQGRFKVPSLRNVALTGPYMHDGSIPDLEGVLDHFAAGGRALPGERDVAAGRDNPNKSPLVSGFVLSSAERGELVSFLAALTDPVVTTDPRWSNPWD